MMTGVTRVKHFTDGVVERCVSYSGLIQPLLHRWHAAECLRELFDDLGKNAAFRG
jgi:hypothetical protein